MRYVLTEMPLDALPGPSRLNVRPVTTREVMEALCGIRPYRYAMPEATHDFLTGIFGRGQLAYGIRPPRGSPMRLGPHGSIADGTLRRGDTVCIASIRGPLPDYVPMLAANDASPDAWPDVQWWLVTID